MSNSSEQANGRASGPVLQSVFLVILDHSETVSQLVGMVNDAALERVRVKIQGGDILGQSLELWTNPRRENETWTIEVSFIKLQE